MAGATRNCCRLGARSVYTIQPCISLLCHFVWSHVCLAHACLVVTFPLHFWHSDQDLLRATAVTWGWNGHRNRNQHKKLTLERKILLPILLGLFDHTEIQSQTLSYETLRCSRIGKSELYSKITTTTTTTKTELMERRKRKEKVSYNQKH